MRLQWLAIAVICVLPCLAHSAMPDATDDEWAAPPVGINENGQTGFIRLPSARRLEPGTAYAGFAFGDPYDQIYAGLQPLPALRVTLRQAYENETGLPYYGFDTQVQLWRENEWRPQAAVGYTHMFGQNRFAGEYLVFNKRFWNFDVMGGLGWGRYANGGLTIANPLHALSDHFDAPARDDGTGKYGPNAWFKGRNIGLFAGVNYQTPWQPLSLQLEYDGDNFVDERRFYDVPRTAPFNVGARFTIPADSEFLPGFAVQAALEDMSRFSVNVNYIVNFNTDASAKTDVPAVSPSAPAVSAVETLDNMRDAGFDHFAVATTADDTTLWMRVPSTDPVPAATVGASAYTIVQSDIAPTDTITVVPETSGLMAGGYRFLQTDLITAGHADGSAEEILQDMQLLPAQDLPLPDTTRGVLQPLVIEANLVDQLSPYDLFLTLTGRQRAFLGARLEPVRGIIVSGAASAQADENLDQIFPSLSRPVRSNVNQYAQQTFGMERAYAAWLFNPAPEFAARLSAGYFEEMYGGVSGELLYQPLAARWAIGLDVNYLAQRDPNQELAFSDYRTVTGAASFYYEMPQYHLTTIIRAEEYLAKDYGISLDMQHRFLDGVQLGFNSTYSNEKDFSGPADFDRLDVSLYLQVPLYIDETATVPVRATATNIFKSFGRDKGQAAIIPDRLYDVSRPVSYSAISQSWGQLLDALNK